MPIVEFLAASHDRAGFDCGTESLNRYLREVARQNADRNLGVTHVIVPESGSARIMGYFTLVTRTVEANVLPEKRLPKGEIGVTLLARLASIGGFKNRAWANACSCAQWRRRKSWLDELAFML